MLARLRRDFAFHSLLWWVPLALAGGIWVWGMSKNSGLELGATPFADGRPPGLAPFVFLWWTWISIYMLNAGLDHRTASIMDLGLPLSSRRLWLEHVTMVLSGGIGILAFVCLTIAAGNLAGGIRPLIQPGISALAIHLGVGLILTTSILQLPKVEIYKIPMNVGHGFYVAATMLGYLVLVFILSFNHPAWAAVPLLLAVVIFAVVFRRIPESSFSMAPRELEEQRSLGTTKTADTATITNTRKAPNVGVTVWRASYGVFGWAYVLPMMLNMGAFLADPSYEERFTFHFFFWIVAFASVVYPLSRLYMVDPLPVSRGRVFAIIMLPPVMAVVLGYGLGVTIREAVFRPVGDVAVQEGSCCTHVKVPFSHWRIASEGDPTLPAGLLEHESDRHFVRPYKGSEMIVYNPYQPSHDATPELVEAAARRARTEIAATGVEWAHPVEALVLLVPWFLIASLAYRATRVRSGEDIGQRLSLLIMSPLVAIGIGLLLLNTVGLVDVSAWSRIASILGRRFVENLPGTTVTAWILAAVFATAGYFLAESQFRRVEAFPKRK